MDYHKLTNILHDLGYIHSWVRQNAGRKCIEICMHDHGKMITVDTGYNKLSELNDKAWKEKLTSMISELPRPDSAYDILSTIDNMTISDLITFLQHFDQTSTINVDYGMYDEPTMLSINRQ